MAFSEWRLLRATPKFLDSEQKGDMEEIIGSGQGRTVTDVTSSMWIFALSGILALGVASIALLVMLML